MNRLILTTIKTAVTHYPAVIPHLKGRARWVAFAFTAEAKTEEQFDSRLTALVRALYNDTITAPDFIDSMAALISRQITLAYREAWKDEDGEGDLPDYLISSSEEMILGQFDFVDGFARDIVDARVDEAPIDGLLARVPLWSNRWNEAFNEALRLIAIENGDKLEWQLGETEQHCPECSALNGVVAYAWEWDEIGVKPQSAPNDALTCGGWKCDCSLSVTDKRRTPKAYDKINSIVAKG